MIGILVSGDNHFIVQGLRPARVVAHALVRHWSLIQIEAVTPAYLGAWRIVTRALREDLAWAVIVVGDGEVSAAVKQLLAELFARGVTVHDFRAGPP